jgi:hypothetical protein
VAEDDDDPEERKKGSRSEDNEAQIERNEHLGD